MQYIHTSVLLKEATDFLQIQKGKRYIDATLGGGGHSRAIIDKGGIVLGVDQDEDAIKNAKLRVENSEFKTEKDITLITGNFADIREIAQKNGFEQVDGILFDLGFSSYHVDASGRGFSFSRDEPLDMRMSKSGELTAELIVNTWSIMELNNIFVRFGEEHNSGKIAEEIVLRRKEHVIQTTKDLAEIIESVVPRIGKLHPATKVFQALRITVNNELENLKHGLQNGFELLNARGRFVVISFHSLEDRIVKNKFKSWENKGQGKILTKKPVVANTDEVFDNPRSRSAKMRVFERM